MPACAHAPHSSTPFPPRPLPHAPPLRRRRRRSYGTGAARPRPASAGPTSYGHTQLGAAYATDPTYALSQSGPYTAIRPLGQPLPTRKGNAPGGVRDMTLLGYAPGRPATAVNSSKRHNDRYYRTHRLARPRSAYPTTGNATRYAYEPYEGEGVRGNASGGVVRHTTYTQNAGAGAADGGAKGAGAGAGESPYAAAADNPFWPVRWGGAGGGRGAGLRAGPARQASQRP